MEDKISKKERVILVTGFGPFRGHEINASWEAVKELRNYGIEKKLNVTLVTEQIPVSYQSVSNIVPQLWAEHDPMLVVHVGVSAVAKCLTLESQANKIGYVGLDVDGKCPLENVADENHCELEQGTRTKDPILETEIDVEKICEYINDCGNDLSDEDNRCKAVVSRNAGRYLCEYIFRQSLTIHKKKTIFVHVPDLGVYSAEKTAEGLADVIKIAVQFLDES